MKKIIWLVFMLSSTLIYPQSLSISNIDVSKFPLVQAKLMVLDNNGKQITNLSKTDFSITENGVIRNVISINCPNAKGETPLSSLLMLDISGSMCGNPLQIVKDAAFVWTDKLQGSSECAVSSFSDNAYINQDFTKNKNKLLNSINSLNCIAGTNFDNAFLDSPFGAIQLIKSGKNRKIIIHISDGGANFPPNEGEIIRRANADSISIFALTINGTTPEYTKNFTEKTGGLWFDNIHSKEDVENAFRFIYASTQLNPCTIDWQSGISCVSVETYCNINLLPYKLNLFASYMPPINSIAKLVINPSAIKMKNIPPGIKKDTLIRITATNSDFSINDIKSSNPEFFVTPTKFLIKKGETKDLTLSFIPSDSGYVYTKLTIENDLCCQTFNASGGFPGKKPSVKTIKLIKPNGSEVLIGGTDTLITWDGVLPDEKVSLEFTTNNGVDWQTITDNATGLNYKWHIPRTPSKNCLARVIAKSKYLPDCPEVKIGNQTWMACNLNVDTYQNGDPIPEIQDRNQWATMTTGAWCYYNNDPANGGIYGKLYNWYAVSDPRGLAPEGWHVASNSDWQELINFLGTGDLAKNKVKSIGTIENADGLWFKPNEGNNETGFSALPSGCRYTSSQFSSLGYSSPWWTSDSSGSSALYQCIWQLTTGIGSGEEPFYIGFAVRCVKNE